MRSTRDTRTWLIVVIAFCVIATTWGCGGNGPDEGVEEDGVISTTVTCDNASPPVKLQLDCPALPNTIASGAWVDGDRSGEKLLDYDLFAWNSFIALNWPAKVPSDANGWKRGFPDTSKSFADAAPADLVVWETLKEKREIFLADPFSGHIVKDPQPAAWNAPPSYGPSDVQVPLCDETGDAELPFGRHIVHSTKANFFDTEDETVEVASEARETDAVLCQGHPSDCNVSGLPVGPRVWLGQPDEGRPVVYEVKVNWDFYDYLQNFSAGPLWKQPVARDAARQGEIRLPARTSAAEKPYVPRGEHVPDAGLGPNPTVTGYSAEACLDGDRATPCPVGSIHLKAAWLPLTEEEAASGKFHVSEAFYYKSLEDAETSEGPYHGPTAAKHDASQPNKCKMPQKFGLVGLHIIQRIHEQRFEQDGTPHPHSHPAGGHFIFATWEHKSNDEAGFTYANYFPLVTLPGGPPEKHPQPYPNVTDGQKAIPLRRVYRPLDSTQAANDEIHQALGCTDEPIEPAPSVWCNYFLVGTQYKPTSVPSPQPELYKEIPQSPLANVESPANSGQPYYLANLVIESNLGLQQFQGAPAGFMPVDHFTSPKPPLDASGRTRGQGGGAPEILPNPDGFKFRHDYDNLAWRIAPRIKPPKDQKQTIQGEIGTNDGQFIGKKQGAFNMGGCMGCHGVAQTGGYSFSFVLLDNQAGGAPDTQDEFEIAPLPLYVN